MMQFLSIILVIYLEKDVLWSFKPHHSSTSLGLGLRDKKINRVEFWGSVSHLCGIPSYGPIYLS